MNNLWATLEEVNTFLEHWEPLWLFLLIGLEALFGLAVLLILVMEYHYDKQFNEYLLARKKRRKKYEKLNSADQAINTPTTSSPPPSPNSHDTR